MSSAVSKALVLFLSFIARSVFIRYLSEVYLGVNGLYSNVLNMLSLAELGFGTAMVFSMYRWRSMTTASWRRCCACTAGRIPSSAAWFSPSDCRWCRYCTC